MAAFILSCKDQTKSQTTEIPNILGNMYSIEWLDRGDHINWDTLVIMDDSILTTTKFMRDGFAKKPFTYEMKDGNVIFNLKTRSFRNVNLEITGTIKGQDIEGTIRYADEHLGYDMTYVGTLMLAEE